MNTEDKIQFEIIKWFRNNYCLNNQNPRGLIFSVPNGGTRNKLEAMKMKSTGLLPGASDLIVIMNGRILFLEVKTETGRLSDVQVEFGQRIKANGFDYAVAYGLDHAKNIIMTKIIGTDNQ